MNEIGDSSGADSGKFPQARFGFFAPGNRGTMTAMRWLLIFAAAAATLSAQTAAPNAAGVSAGHIHLQVPDPEAMVNTVANVLGGEKMSKGPLNMVKLPNIFVIVTPKADVPLASFVICSLTFGN